MNKVSLNKQETSSDYNCSLAGPAAGGPIKFSGYWPGPPTLPHTYYSRSCTIGSVVNTTSIGLRDYTVESLITDDGKATLLGTFTLVNPGPVDTYKLDRIPVIADGVWHDCVAGESGQLPWQLVKCRYSLDRGSHHVGFQLEWFCDDRDPSNAYDLLPLKNDNTVLTFVGVAESYLVQPPWPSCRLKNAIG